MAFFASDRFRACIHRLALKVSLVYLAVGLAWIFFSDTLAFEIAGSSTMFLRFEEFKGFGFIIVTTVLLYGLICYFERASTRQQQELFQSDTRYRKLYESMMDAFASIDMEGRIQEFNPSFQQMLGYTPEELRGFTYRDITPEKWHGFEEMILRDQILPFGHSEVYEKEYRRKDGTVFPVELRTFLLRDQTGKPSGMWAIIRDITERKRAENTLRESEKKYRSFVEDVMGIFYQTDREGRLIYASPTAPHYLGYSSIEELIGRPIISFWANPGERDAMIAQMREKGYVRDYEVNILKKDQTVLQVSVSSRFRHGETGEVGGVEGVIRDSTEQKRYEQALKLTNQKLNLMNVITWHDIQNKITGLRGYAELSKTFVTEGTLKQFVEREEEILKTIDKELQYTKEYQQIGVRPPQWIAIPELVERIASLKAVPLPLVLDIHSLEIYCDPVIEHVFSSLIDNTLQHGEKATSIRLRYRETAQGLVLIYEDDGIGVPYERKRELFLRGVGSTTWFSLFFAHDILEISGMTIEETGIPGMGARFEIIVPRGSYRFRQAAG
jgi:PAS domain S-box-containing protein